MKPKIALLCAQRRNIVNWQLGEQPGSIARGLSANFAHTTSILVNINHLLLSSESFGNEITFIISRIRLRTRWP